MQMDGVAGMSSQMGTLRLQKVVATSEDSNCLSHEVITVQCRKMKTNQTVENFRIGGLQMIWNHCDIPNYCKKPFVSK